MATFPKPDRPQVFFRVEDMTSDRAAAVIRGTLKCLDAGAGVRIDVPMRRVEIDPQSAEPVAYRDAIRSAGYSAVRQWPADDAYLWG